jgi:hypothetical protein
MSTETNNNTITVVGLPLSETISTAQLLMKRRENWKATLDKLPCPKVSGTDFPYGSLEAAIADDFKLFFGGKDHAFRLLVKGFKTELWRKGAEKNRDSRDMAAEGEGRLVKAKRIRAARKAKSEAAKSEAA